MKKKLSAVFLLCALLAAPALAHDLFLKPDNFFPSLNRKLSISVLNGTFQSSDGAVAFERLTDVSVIAPGGARTNPKEAAFTKNQTTAFLNLTPAEVGNYVVGLSTNWRENQLKAAEFNKYLVLEGMPNILEDRKRDKELDVDGRYRYSKYVKTIFQVGARQTDNYQTPLGYAVEMIPRQNPYRLKRGATIEILCLKDGEPLTGQLVGTGYESLNGKHVSGANLTSDENGIIRIRLIGAGKWYAKFINMVKINDPKLNYESKWATLTFEIK